MKFLFSLFSISLIPIFCYAQIKIEEKVEIDPQIITSDDPGSGIEHIFTYTLSWTPDEYRRGNIQIVEHCGDTLNSGWSTSGITTISFPAKGRHHYLFQEERWFYNNWYGWGWYSSSLPGRLLQVFLDEINLNHPQNVRGSYNGIPNEFDLKFNGSICPNNFAELSIANINWFDCNNPGFYDGDPLELNIVEGAEFTEFFDINTSLNLGSTVQLNDYADIQNIGLTRIENAPFVQDTQTVKVEANINGAIDISEIDYYPDIYTLVKEIYPDSTESMVTGDWAYLYFEYFNSCENLPDETKINIEIIQGQEYGNLEHPITEERVKVLTNLDHWYGSISAWYIADGISPEETGTVVFRVSTTDPELMTAELTLYIKPPPIYVYTVPDVVGADDTADVIIKHRLEDGTLEDFPPEQTFELAVLDGCVNGNFLVDTTVNVYFAEAQQPIKFVTADSLDEEYDKVAIRIGTDLEGYMRPLGNIKEEEKPLNEKQREPVGNSGYTRSEKIAGFKKMIAEKKAEVEAEKNEGITPPLEVPIITACALDDPTYLNYWQGFAGLEDETLDHFEITIIPDTLAAEDTLAFGEGAKLIIQAKDVEDNDVELQNDILLTFILETNENYGTFIDANGDTLRNTPVLLSNITYQNANDGQIKFAAVKENPDSVVKCLIKVVLEEDTTINGEREAVVLEQTLKIEMAGDYVVQPIITSEYNDMGSTAYQNAINENNRKFFKIRLTRGGKLLKNHRIKLSTNYVDGSGGHDHILDRRPASGSTSNLTERYRRLHYGSFYSYSSGTTFNTTDMRGMIYERSREDTVSRFEYVASIWGDEMKIYLESLENSLLNKDSVTIIERIPDLQLLPDNANYDKVGGTCNHHGPRNDNEHLNCRTPDNNHYASANILQDIVAIANDWHANHPTEHILRINDISLPNGGKFDVDGSWRGPHQTHRNGEDIDIRTELYFYNRQGQVIHRDGGVPVRTPRTETFNLPYVGNELVLNPNSILSHHRGFRTICEENNFTADLHNRYTTNEHYHLDLD